MIETPRTAHTFELAPSELAEIRALMEAAFDGDFSEEDWDHTVGGVHVLLYDAEGLAAHGSVVMRRVLHGGRFCRVGYVEGVAVRADRRRQGLGGRVMGALERVVDGAYEFGALSASDAGAALYLSRGWRRWTGRIEGVGPQGLVHLPDEEGSVFLWGEVPGEGSALAFDWRDGDVL
jgi:aminoglycoside 2'-N-acetyltransferase I